MLFRLGGETKRGVGFCRRRHCHPHFQREGAAAGVCTCHPRTTRCASSAAHPEQTNPRKTPSKAQHTLHQRRARIGNERACVLCFVFGDVNPKSVQKGAALAPMHSVTLCVRECSCGWCPNTVSCFLFVAGGQTLTGNRLCLVRKGPTRSLLPVGPRRRRRSTAAASGTAAQPPSQSRISHLLLRSAARWPSLPAFTRS